jgi:hypothetical protein
MGRDAARRGPDQRTGRIGLTIQPGALRGGGHHTTAAPPPVRTMAGALPWDRAMPLRDHNIPGIVEDDRVTFSMGDDQGKSIVVEVYSDALAAADPQFPGTPGEMFVKNRARIADAESRKFDVQGADPKGVLRLTSTDVAGR